MTKIENYHTVYIGIFNENANKSKKIRFWSLVLLDLHVCIIYAMKKLLLDILNITPKKDHGTFREKVFSTIHPRNSNKIPQPTQILYNSL